MNRMTLRRQKRAAPRRPALRPPTSAAGQEGVRSAPSFFGGAKARPAKTSVASILPSRAVHPPAGQKNTHIIVMRQTKRLTARPCVCDESTGDSFARTASDDSARVRRRGREGRGCARRNREAAWKCGERARPAQRRPGGQGRGVQAGLRVGYAICQHHLVSIAYR